MRFLTWIFNVLRWTGKWWRLWIALCPLAIGVLSLTFWLSASEPGWRLTGLALQVLGIITVLWGIKRTRVFFGQPGWLARARQRFSEFPRLRPRHYTMSGLSGGITMTGSASGLVVHSPKNLPVEDRLEALENEVRLRKVETEKLRAETDQKVSKLSDGIRDEKQLRAEEYKRLNEKMKNTATGDLWLAQMGAVWLFIGVLLSTASVELAKWF